MSSIFEDEVNMMFNFSDETPSSEQLAEYVEWKTKRRAELVEYIKDMDFEERERACWDWYGTTVEWRNSKHINDYIESQNIGLHRMFLAELTHIVGLSTDIENPENNGYGLARCSQAHRSHTQRISEQRDYSQMLIATRMPILADLKWIIFGAQMKKELLDRIPK